MSQSPQPTPNPSAAYDCTDTVTRHQGIEAAAKAVRAGRLVVLPTDTVYGLGADAFQPDAVRRLLAVKGRGPDVPVPVLVGSWAGLSGLTLTLPPAAQPLIEAFWPGALTLVVRHAPTLAWDLGNAHGTVAVRMPLHPVALELLDRTGPMAVSSANRHHHPPAATVDEARAQLGDDVPVYLDGGPAEVGEPSSILDLTGDEPVLLRAGALDLPTLTAVAGPIRTAPGTEGDTEAEASPTRVKPARG